MSMNLKQMRGEILMKRDELKDLIIAAKQARAAIKNMRAILREEAKIARIVKQDARQAKKVAVAAKKAERAAARDAKRNERIAKMEAKLLALRSPRSVRKANQKASEAVVYTADQIAALNAARA